MLRACAPFVFALTDMSLSRQTSPIAAQPLGMAEHTVAVSESSAIGDWLLTFGETGTLPRRQPGVPWTGAMQSGDATLWLAAPGAGWRGMPMVEIHDGSWSVYLCGELYGTSSPRQLLHDVVSGRVSGSRLNGHFLLLGLHRERNEWHVWTNRHATLHAYKAQNGSRVAVGTFCPAVAAATGRTELDWEGLTTFFGFGYFAADHTHLAGVGILRPATHYRFDARGQLMNQETYWRWWHAPDERRSYDDTVDEFSGLFETVMGDLVGTGRIAVPISGGLDSRTTVAAIAPGPTHDRLWAYSYGYSADSVETAIARRVAGARGLPFDAYIIEPYLFPMLSGVTAAVEGFEDVTQCRQAAVVAEIGAHADFLIAAHLGDLYLDDMGLAGIEAMSAEEITAVTLKKVRKTGGIWLLDHLCQPHLGAVSPESVLRDHVAGELGRLEAIAEPDFRIKAFKVDQWCARWTTVALRMYQAAAFPRLPFYDTRLADFFLTVPTAMLGGRRLQIDYLRRYAPDLAGITWQATGRDLVSADRAGLNDWIGRAVARGLRAVRRQQVVERNWEIQFAGPDGQAGLRHWLMRPGLVLHSFVAPDAIRELLAAFERDPYTDKRSYAVSMLLSFSAWLEAFYQPSAEGGA